MNAIVLPPPSTTQGVVSQVIKDVNQSLVDDGLVNTDKIGSSNFYWSFPAAEGIKAQKNLEMIRQQVGRPPLAAQSQTRRSPPARNRSHRSIHPPDARGARTGCARRPQIVMMPLLRSSAVQITEMRAKRDRATADLEDARVGREEDEAGTRAKRMRKRAELTARCAELDVK